LKSLNYNSPYDIIIKQFDENNSNFHRNPAHEKAGLNIYDTIYGFLNKFSIKMNIIGEKL
ncbi:MAG: hypothetical protein ACTSXQ_01555, partial [Alphaproteobacteria bacterium]